MESIDLGPFPAPSPSAGAKRAAGAIKAADEAFENSDLLSILKQNSLENREKCVDLS